VRCPQNTLNKQSGSCFRSLKLAEAYFIPVKVLSAFFCDKLDDTETIVPALKGLASLPPICSSSDALVIINAQVFCLYLKPTFLKTPAVSLPT
jgi:DNA repair/transcription protein MET18/MMS19